MRRRLILTAFIAATVAIALPTVAHARTKIAVLGLEAKPGAEAIAAKLTSAIARALKKTSGIKVVKGQSLLEVKMVFGCTSANRTKYRRCIAKAGKSFRARKVVVGTVARSGGGFKVEVSLIDVRRPQQPKVVSGTLTARMTSGSALAGEVTDWVGGLLGRETKGTVKLVCNIQDVQVKVNGADAALCGTTGAAIKLRPGRHTLTFVKAGVPTQTRRITVRVGKTQSLSLRFRRPPPPRRIEPRRVEPRRVEPRRVEPRRVEPRRVEPRRVEPRRVEPRRVEPTIIAKHPGVTPTLVTTKRRDPNLVWKILFFSTAGIGAVMLLSSIGTGAKVKSLEKEKEDYIRGTWSGPNPVTDTRDACSNNNGHQQLVSICNRGVAHATATNVLLGLGTAVLGAAGAFLYMAYFRKPATSERPEKSARFDAKGIPGISVQPEVWIKGGGVKATIEF